MSAAIYAAFRRRSEITIPPIKQKGPGADEVRAEAKGKVQRDEHTSDDADRAS